jgi:hypothetical protein
MELLSPKTIEDKILNNYSDYQYLFINFQSKFLSGLYSRYQSLESGKLILHFGKETHQDILRKKDYDLNFNVSYEKFWDNHNEIEPRRRSIIKIAEETFLPKETARRKVSQLIQQKVLNKKNRNIGWLPNEQYKQNYNLFIKEEINDVCDLINFICKKINLNFSREILMKEIKKKFSFYWFHFLKTQLEYLKLWNKQFSDLELLFIGMQVASLFATRAKEKKLPLAGIYNDSSLNKDFVNLGVSVTSIVEVTGMPRATCFRKLEILVRMKVILQDKISKKYYLIPNASSKNLFSQNSTESVVKLFSNFYFICLRAIDARILNQ